MTTALNTKLTTLSLRGGGSRGSKSKVDSNVTFFLDKKSNQSAAADKTWIFLLKNKNSILKYFETRYAQTRKTLVSRFALTTN
jgi:hypothetical protein